MYQICTRFPSVVLAKSLFHCFYLTYSDDDYNVGMAILDKAISFRGPGDTPSPYQEMALRTAVKFSYIRFHASGEPKCLEQAIDLLRTLLDGISLEDPRHDAFIRLFFREWSNGRTACSSI